MDTSQQIYQKGLVAPVLNLGGSIHPLIIPAEKTNGTGLMNPSILIDGSTILCNIRHVNYTLYHSENKKFQHRYGPLQYLHPENDMHLRTWNHLCILNEDLTIRYNNQVDTAKLDVTPIWEFVGLEDGRLVKWDNKYFLTGVRRDTTTHGEGRMELSELNIKTDNVREINRMRIPATGANNTYCEKNWMPIIDQPFHYVKWSNPTEVVKYDPHYKTTTVVHSNTNNYIPGLPDFRGGSQVIPYGDRHYIALIHEVNLFKSPAGEKDAVYRHRFVVWDRNWNMVKYTNSFSFMNADIEFCCGAAFHKDNLLITFGYQDNCAFILKMPTSVLDAFVWNSNDTGFYDATPDGFDWGNINNNSWFRQYVMKEVFIDQCYKKFVDVEPGDVVVDIGASVGPFAWSIADKKPSKLICLEPVPELYKTLTKNLQTIGLDAIILNKGLSNANGLNMLCGTYDETRIDHSDGTDGKLLETISWNSLLNEHDIDHIDFLKLDCEGAEYNIFTDENLPWILKNVRKISMEIHLYTPEEKQKFKHFRDTYLKAFSKFEVMSLDWVDIKWSVFDDWFTEHYQAVMIYIDNRDSVSHAESEPVFQTTIEKWQKYPAPTLEITTIIPEKGCVVDCVFCPQRLLEKTYKGERILTLDNFKKLIDKVPDDVRITFAGFTEPWMNKYCTEMVLYAHEQGHPVSVFTTGVGVSIEDLEAIVDIPYAGNPNGGFVLHLPDSEMLARHPITPGYIKTLEWIRDNQHRIKNFAVMTMGTDVHPAVKHIFSSAPNYAMWSRGGNLVRESLLKPKLLALKDRWNTSYQEGSKTCGCVEHLYHNVMLPNGDISLCCMDYGLENILGNLHDKNYQDIIPEDQACFPICNYCENAADPKPIKFY